MPSRSTKKTNVVAAPNWIVSALLLPLSIPLLAVMDMGRWLKRRMGGRRERSFVQAMRERGRVLEAAEFAARMGRGEGTAIDEAVTAEGPWRIWWTEEEVVAESPFPVASGEWVMVGWESRWFPFFGWAAGRYLDETAGRAWLVDMAGAEERRIVELARAGRHVTVCTFARGAGARAAGA